MSVIPILLTFIYLVALNLLVNNQLNSTLRHIIVTKDAPYYLVHQMSTTNEFVYF